MSRQRPSVAARSALALGAGLALLAVGFVPIRQEQEDATVKIEAIEKQIQELTAELEKLRAGLEQAEPEEPAGPAVDPSWVDALEWRSIGPAAMGGRVVDLAVVESDPSTFWVATASGGLLKTTNNGITFEHQFDRQETVSIGDVAVAPSNPEIVWVGTGEQNPRNSVSYGDGVYRSNDGGRTWDHKGLADSYQIGRIAIHPVDPNIVYVGALGRLYGPNEERGLYKTTDGGETWEKVLFIDENTGIIDVQMSPADPETLLVAAYERRRDGFDLGDPAVKYGPGAGIYRTTDGGKSFAKVTEGLPTCQLGRIGLDFSRSDPNVVLAIVESEKIGMGPEKPVQEKPAYLGLQGEDVAEGVGLTVVTPDGPAAKAGLKVGDVITTIGDDTIERFRDLIAVLGKHEADEEVTVTVRREGEPIEMTLTFGERPGREGADPERPFGGLLEGQQANKQGVQGEEGFEYGGVYKSTDGGTTWTRINSLNPRPMYFSQIRVDPSDGDVLYVLGIGLDRSTNGGETFQPDAGRGVHADHHALWIDPRDGRHMILGCDGGTYVTYDRGASWDHHNQKALGQFYHVAVDSRRMYHAYGGLQDNGTWGGPVALRGDAGPVNADWLQIGGGDGFGCQVDPDDPDLIYYTSQYGALQRIDLGTGERAAIRPDRGQGKSYRYNWNTPFILSSHNPRIYYAAGNYVFKSLDRGDDLKIISPEITRTDQGSATAIGESPVDPDILYVGTDDGALWLTNDGGTNWEDATDRLGLPGPRGIATIEPSRFEAGRCYVAVDGHRNDDDAPYLLVTEDYGKSWSSITANLPRGSTRCLREDVKNRDLLYCGTEFALWFSVDRGRSWQRLNGDELPTVAIHEVAIHPTAGEIVAATHGRSLWVLDVAPLQQMTEDVLEAKFHLYEPMPAVRWRSEPSRGGTNRAFVGENPDDGAVLYYSMIEEAEKVSLKIVDATGAVLRTLRASREPGLHRVVWDLSHESTRGGRGRPRRVAVRPGTYGVVLEVDGESMSVPLIVERDPILPVDGVIAADEEERELDDDLDIGEEEEEGTRAIDY